MIDFMIQEINHNNQLLAIIISHKYSEPGIHFFTPDDFSQQMAFMKHPEGKTTLKWLYNYTEAELFCKNNSSI